MNRLMAFGASVLFAIAAQAQDKKPAENKPSTDAKPAETKPETKAQTGGDGTHPRVKLETTLGDIVVELDGEKAPISTDNFVTYVEEKFYDGLIFHRVIPTFMIQGGGFTPEIEKKKSTHPAIKNEWRNGLKNTRGTIAMARTSVPDSATNEFFINVVDNAFLDQPNGGAAYAVFGKVVEGMETVDKIKDTKTIVHPKYPSGTQPVVPETAVVIKSATLLTKFDREKVKAGIRTPEMDLADAQKKIEAETGKKMEKSASGLMWVVLKEGTGNQPSANNMVDVHYTGWYLDGRKFDSSYDRGTTPTTFKLSQVIKGWTEGVALMKAGEKRKFLIPSNLAYGERGFRDIPPNTPLMFEIELMGFK